MMTEIATLGGGCFWCTEAVFKRLKGVEKVTSGYSGGTAPNPSYEDIISGTTNHAESIQIEFDSSILSYERLLQVFFATHDPTTINRQGADIGTQYRSVIFFHNENQHQTAEKVKKSIQNDYDRQIVTKIIPFEKFYTAEEYHQNYYENNPQNPYCSLVIDPKIQKLIQKFNEDVRDEYKP